MNKIISNFYLKFHNKLLNTTPIAYSNLIIWTLNFSIIQFRLTLTSYLQVFILRTKII